MLIIVWEAHFFPDRDTPLLPHHRRFLSMLGDPSQPSVARTVLIVEDNELNLKLLNDILEYQGYTVFTTRLGEPALELARQYRPDLILMDIQLPDISGMEATRRLKADEQTRSIPVIAVTAFAMSGDEEKIRASGCDAYVAKPFNVTEFLKVIEDWTTRNRA
jgi:two-component system, cell cycle response regulator DivK